MTTKELLDFYYKGFAAKTNWSEVISDDFKFIGGDMTKPEPIVGKAAYINIIQRFSRLFESMKVQSAFIDNDKACVIANYDYIFPGNKRINGNVAEIWTVEKEKLASLTIIFDTLTFSLMTK